MSGIDIRSIPPNDRVKKLSNPPVSIDVNLPLKRYFRSGLEVLRQADSYFDSQDYEKCYQYYMKYITLYFEQIPTHPEYKSVLAADKKDIKQKLNEVFSKAEAIKVKLTEKYQAEHEAYLVEKERQDREKQKLLKQQAENKRKLSTSERRPLGGPALHQDRIEALDRTYAQVKQAPLLPDNIYPSFDSLMSDLPTRITAGAKPDPPSSQSLVSSVPSFDRAQKPSMPPQSKDFGQSDFLRPVVIPAQLLSSFQSLAQRNTERNVETCGILAGRLVQSELHITHLLVPKQAGTADSCITHHEEEIFACQDKFNLITLGWIHTHPSQTAFLSSVDLHTHCSYQLMMPEAIAIVCAPKHNEQGVFCLTPHYGLDVIANCRQTTGFHPHPNDAPLFMIAEHSRMDYQSSVEVIDMRNS